MVRSRSRSRKKNTGARGEWPELRPDRHLLDPHLNARLILDTNEAVFATGIDARVSIILAGRRTEQPPGRNSVHSTHNPPAAAACSFVVEFVPSRHRK